MAYGTPYEDGGIVGPNRKQALMDALSGMTGGTAGPAAAPPIAPPAEQAAAPTRDFSRLTGYDAGKFNANKNDAKYQIGGALSQFDPRQGITPDVLAQLNGLGYGTFSGSGQKLSLHGLTDAGRAAKLSGDYDNADFIQGFSGGNGKWGYSDPVAEAQQAQASPQGQAPQAGGMFSGSGIPPMLQGDAIGGINAALQNIGGLSNSSRLQQLIAALSGGQ